MTRPHPIMLAAAVALSLGIVSPKTTPLDKEQPLSKSDVTIAASDDTASGAQGSAKIGKVPENKNNGQTVNTQANSDKLTTEPSK